MYSGDTEAVCALCAYSEPAKGVEAYCVCTKRSNEYVAAAKSGCELYKYDIFKRKVSRKRNTFDFSPKDFAL